MQRLLLTLIVLSMATLGAFAAKYKINTSGKVTTPSGKVQHNIVPPSQTNLYNNYSSQQYVTSQQVKAGQVGTILIVMDYSGSMSNWISEAKRSMAQIISQIPSSTRIGFRVFGQNGGNNAYHPKLATVKSIVKGSDGKYKVKTASASYLGNTSGSCSATTRVSPVLPNNSFMLLSGMNSVSIGGSTPLTYALEQGVSQDFSGLAMNSPKKIVLITDGGENCGGDPCAFAQSLMQKRKDIHIDVVLVSSSSRKLQCLTQATGGKFYNTNDLSSFSNVLIQSMQSAPTSSTKPTQGQKYEFVGE